MHEAFAALSAFFDPLAVAAALMDTLAAQAEEPKQGEILPSSQFSATLTFNDHDLLRRLLPQDLYRYWKEAGYAGMYSMTFLLRHAVTFLALAAHENARAEGLHDLSTCPGTYLNEHYDAPYEALTLDCINMLNCFPRILDSSQRSFAPVLGFSSVGIHLTYRPAGLCRAFDYYSFGTCTAQADDLFCHAHGAEAWWCRCVHKLSTQAEMFRFYALIDNISHYDEQQLQELVGRFWEHFRTAPRHVLMKQHGIDEALVFFEYSSIAEFMDGGHLELRKRYTQRARLLHPDSGGEHELFVLLAKNYEVLRIHFSYERAGLFC